MNYNELNFNNPPYLTRHVPINNCIVAKDDETEPLLFKPLPGSTAIRREGST